MGEDKALLPFQNFDTLIEYQHNKLSKIFSKICISSKTDKFNFNANILFDENKNIHSPMIALQSILSNIKEEKVFITTVDVPFLEEQTIHTLCDKSINYDITIAKDKNYTHNLCGVFSTKLLPQIKELLNNDIHKINALIKRSNTQEILFENEKQFININTKIEYNNYK